MNIKGILLDKKSLIIFAVLILGLIAAVYLVQQRQIFKPKASQDIYNAFQITQGDGDVRVNCVGNECNVNSLKVKIKADPAELERLGSE